MVLKLLFVSLAIPCPFVRAWNTFTVPRSQNPSADDAPGLITALATGNLSSNTTILFEKGQTYNIFSPIKFPVFQNVEVAVEGNITYPEDIPTVQGKLSRQIQTTRISDSTLSYSCCFVFGKSRFTVTTYVRLTIH